MSSVRPVVAVAVLVLTVVALSTVASASATTGSADSPVDTEAATDAATAGGATPTDAATEATDATPNETDRNATDAAVVQTVTYERTPERPGWIRATYQYRIGPNASTVVVYDYEEALVVESRGFVGEKDGRWRWNGRTPTPTITATAIPRTVETRPPPAICARSAFTKPSPSTSCAATSKPIRVRARNAARHASGSGDSSIARIANSFSARGFSCVVVIYVHPLITSIVTASNSKSSVQNDSHTLV